MWWGWTHFYGLKLFLDNFGQKLNPKTGLTAHHQWLSKHAGLIGRSKEEFIVHYKKKYGLPVAIWVACEVWDFGCLSTLFTGLKQVDQDKIASRYGIANGRTLASWIRSLNYLRNICAHHSRLWNRNIVDQPKLPTAQELPWVANFSQGSHELARPFLLFCIAQQFLTIINPTSSWWQRLKQLISEFPALDHIGLNTKGLGIPVDWELWNWPDPTKSDRRKKTP